MGELLNSLPDISKLEAGAVRSDITDFQVERIFERLRAEFSALAEAKGLDLIIESSDKAVRSDPALLGQIIRNLIGNAIRYTRRGWVRLNCLCVADTVRIEVVDTGVGISADELDAIFEAYCQAREHSDGARAGVGLELAVSRSIADLPGCALEVKWTIGRGSSFYVTVPRAHAPANAAGAGFPSAAYAPAEGARILVIDDDPGIADAMSLLLGALSLECTAASGTAEALDAIENWQRSPDLIICDYHLGEDETGIDAVSKIRDAVCRQVPVIILSGDTSSGMALAASEVAECRVLGKPVDAEDLVCHVTHFLQRAEGRPGSGTEQLEAMSPHRSGGHVER